MTSDNCDFYGELLKETQSKSRVFSVHISAHPYTHGWGEPNSLLDIIGASDEQLTSSASSTLYFLENSVDPRNPFLTEWIDFKRKMIAYREIQDIFPLPIQSREDFLIVGRLWYFYYEADYLLKESLLCGLSFLNMASLSVLRSALEFSVLQMYHYRVMKMTGNLSRLVKYFGDGINPTFNSALKLALPNDSFNKPIKKKLQLLYGHLSNLVSHPHTPYDSPRNQSFASGIPNLGSTYFWLMNREVLESILWLYYSNFPMLFHPLNLFKKFGASRPVGDLSDEVLASAVGNSLSEEDKSLFQSYSMTETVLMEVDHVNSMPDITGEKLIISIDSDFSGTIDEAYPGAYILAIAKTRSLRGSLSLDLRQSPKFRSAQEDVKLENKEQGLTAWKRVYKKYK